MNTILAGPVLGRLNPGARIHRVALTLICVCTLLCSCAVLPPQLPGGPEPRTPREFTDYLQRIVDAGDPPGLGFVALDRSGVLYSKGFGRTGPEGAPAMTTGHVFQWWSLTKIFTAVAVLQLEERGLLALSDPVTKHLDFFQVRDAGAKDPVIRIEHLLDHSSGLPDVGSDILSWVHFEGDPHPHQTQLIREHLPRYNRVGFPAGREASYTNIGYMLLAAVIESVSGLSYAEYIQASILDPLDMRDTGFVYNEALLRRDAGGSHPRDLMSLILPFYIDMDRAVRTRREGRIWFRPIYADQQGSTGLIGTPDDLAVFLRALLNDGRYPGGRILSSSSVRRMSQPGAQLRSGPFKGMSMGPGWFIDETPEGVSLSHAGAGAAFVCMMRLYPEEGRSYIIMANSTYLGRSMGGDILDRAARIDWKLP